MTGAAADTDGSGLVQASPANPDASAQGSLLEARSRLLVSRLRFLYLFAESLQCAVSLRTRSDSRNGEDAAMNVGNPRNVLIVRVPLFISLLVMLGCSSQAQRLNWVTVYYPVWAMRPLGSAAWAIPPWEIDWTGITHVVHFNNTNVDSTPPFYRPVRVASDSIDLEFLGITNPGNGQWVHWQDSLITIAHRHAVKVLLNLSALGGSGEKSLAYIAADSSRVHLLVSTMVGYARRKGYDGVEIDWEPPSNRQDLSRLLRMFRRGLDELIPGGQLLLSPGSGQQNLYDPAVTNALVDQINLQLYDYAHAWGGAAVGANVTWYTSPLSPGKIPRGMEGAAWSTRGPLQWIAAGHREDKLGVGIPLFGYVLKNQNELFQPMASGGDYGYARYQDCLALLGNGGREGWDEERKVPYISGVALRTEGNTWWGQPGVSGGQKFFATYENPRSVREKVRWAQDHHLGGIMVYDLTMDWDGSKPKDQHDPLLSAIREAIGDTTVGERR